MTTSQQSKHTVDLCPCVSFYFGNIACDVRKDEQLFWVDITLPHIVLVEVYDKDPCDIQTRLFSRYLLKRSILDLVVLPALLHACG